MIMFTKLYFHLLKLASLVHNATQKSNLVLQELLLRQTHAVLKIIFIDHALWGRSQVDTIKHDMHDCLESHLQPHRIRPVLMSVLPHKTKQKIGGAAWTKQKNNHANKFMRSMAYIQTCWSLTYHIQMFVNMIRKLAENIQKPPLIICACTWRLVILQNTNFKVFSHIVSNFAVKASRYHSRCTVTLKLLASNGNPKPALWSCPASKEETKHQKCVIYNTIS